MTLGISLVVALTRPAYDKCMAACAFCGAKTALYCGPTPICLDCVKAHEAARTLTLVKTTKNEFAGSASNATKLH